MSGPGAAATTSAGVTHRSAIRRWFVLAPALAGIVLCAIGGALVTPTSDGGLPAYLCVLIGGWAVAFSAVNALSGWEERWQWAGHIALTAGAFALAVSITPLIQEAATLPEPWGRSLAVVALGIPPAAGWMMITLLGRISARVDRAASHRAASVTPPQWSGPDGRPEVTVNASLFTVRALTALVVGTIIAGGVLAVALLIGAERWVLRLPPLMLVVVLGALIAMPLSAAVHVVVNRRRRPVTIRWRTGAVEIDTGERWTVPFPMIQRLVWCPRGDTARVEIHTATRSETLLVGMVRQESRAAAELPTLQRRMRAALQDSGLRPSERRGVLRFDRAKPPTVDAVSGVSAPVPLPAHD